MLEGPPGKKVPDGVARIDRSGRLAGDSAHSPESKEMTSSPDKGPPGSGKKEEKRVKIGNFTVRGEKSRKKYEKGKTLP